MVPVADVHGEGHGQGRSKGVFIAREIPVKQNFSSFASSFRSGDLYPVRKFRLYLALRIWGGREMREKRPKFAFAVKSVSRDF